MLRFLGFFIGPTMNNAYNWSIQQEENTRSPRLSPVASPAQREVKGVSHLDRHGGLMVKASKRK
jgi:hypothetical protein